MLFSPGNCGTAGEEENKMEESFCLNDVTKRQGPWTKHRRFQKGEPLRLQNNLNVLFGRVGISKSAIKDGSVERSVFVKGAEKGSYRLMVITRISLRLENGPLPGPT